MHGAGVGVGLAPRTETGPQRLGGGGTVGVADQVHQDGDDGPGRRRPGAAGHLKGPSTRTVGPSPTGATGAANGRVCGGLGAGGTVVVAGTAGPVAPPSRGACDVPVDIRIDIGIDIGVEVCVDIGGG